MPADLDTESRREAAAPHRASGEGFLVLADVLPQMVWSTTADGKPDYFNARWYEFTGVAEGATNGDAWIEVIHPDDRERAGAAWCAAYTTGAPYEIEYRLRHIRDEYRWTLAQAAPKRDDNGDIVRWYGACTDIHEQKKLLEERQIVSQELSHRIKNIFSIIAGMVSLSARRYPESKVAADDLRRRILALGRAHDFVRPHSKESAPQSKSSGLHGMLRQIFDPYDLNTGPRILIAGDDPIIDDRATTPLALLFHELATNTAKYGALSLDGGRVLLNIRDGGGEFVLDWVEHGGPEIKGPPAALGFGTQLMELSAVRQLGARLERDWAPDGLRVRLIAPASSLIRPL